MGQSVYPAVSAKTRFATTLTSGTSYTVPAGVTYLNVTLVGGGGGGGSSVSPMSNGYPDSGLGGQIVSSTFATTPGAAITYAIGAGGGGAGGGNAYGGTGGTTTMTGATSAVGGQGGRAGGSNGGNVGTAYLSASNGGQFGNNNNPGGAGGVGSILVEYWL